MRKLPQGLPDNIDDLRAQLEAQSQKSRITQVREYRIITALFGGGVEPNHADPITVVRATEVRGHLRFWWRATRGGQYATLAELQAAEAAIWGAAATPDGKVGQSAVWVEVAVLERGESLTVRWMKWQKEEQKRVLQPPSCDVGDPSSPLSYVAFPLREVKDKTGTSKQSHVLSMVRFAVTFSYISEEIEVQGLGKKLKVATELDAALWAWETFGGIGARTRRGFGALRCLSISRNGTPEKEDLPPSDPAKALEWINDKLTIHGCGEHRLKGEGISLLPTKLKPSENCWLGTITKADHHASPVAEPATVDMWVGLFTKMKDFRQQRKKSNPPGRNRWPEPDAIRRLTERRSRRHGNDVSDVDKFPRAAFGLPMQFKFKDSDDPDGKNPLLPKQQEEVLDRFASPLILKPLACSDGVIGLALILANTAVPTTLSIETSRGKKNVSSDLTSDEAVKLKRVDNEEPLLGTETDVLKAFLRFLQL